MLRSHSRSEDPAEPRPEERAVGIGRSVTTYPDLEVPVPLSGSGYQGRRGCDTFPPAGGNSDPGAPKGSPIAPSARAGAAEGERVAHAQPCRSQCGTAWSLFLCQRGPTELKPALPIAKRALHCWARVRPIILRSIGFVARGLKRSDTVPHGKLA